MVKPKIFKYALVGISVSVFDFIVYSIVAGFFLSDVLWIATAISGVSAACLAYILHSNITWKTRDPGKYGVIKFFAWNSFTMLIVRPFLALILDKPTWLYRFVLNICKWLRLPFDYNFVKNTGVWVISILVVAALNFFVYNRLIFGKEKKEKRGKKINMGRVRKTGEKQNRKRVSHNNGKKPK